jgi:hypothetical protein
MIRNETSSAYFCAKKVAHGNYRIYTSLHLYLRSPYFTHFPLLSILSVTSGLYSLLYSIHSYCLLEDADFYSLRLGSIFKKVRGTASLKFAKPFCVVNLDFAICLKTALLPDGTLVSLRIAIDCLLVCLAAPALCGVLFLYFPRNKLSLYLALPFQIPVDPWV